MKHHLKNFAKNILIVASVSGYPMMASAAETQTTTRTYSYDSNKDGYNGGNYKKYNKDDE